MTTSEEAGRAEIIRQIQHFTKLGKDKPEDHEYNLTARGLQRFLAEEPTRKTHQIRIWTCESLGTSALTSREYSRNSVSDAAKYCSCLKEGCDAVLLDIRYSYSEVEHLSSSEVQNRINNGT